MRQREGQNNLKKSVSSFPPSLEDGVVWSLEHDDGGGSESDERGSSVSSLEDDVASWPSNEHPSPREQEAHTNICNDDDDDDDESVNEIIDDDDDDDNDENTNRLEHDELDENEHGENEAQVAAYVVTELGAAETCDALRAALHLACALVCSPGGVDALRRVEAKEVLRTLGDASNNSSPHGNERFVELRTCCSYLASYIECDDVGAVEVKFEGATFQASTPRRPATSELADATSCATLRAATADRGTAGLASWWQSVSNGWADDAQEKPTCHVSATVLRFALLRGLTLASSSDPLIAPSSDEDARAVRGVALDVAQRRLDAALMDAASGSPSITASRFAECFPSAAMIMLPGSGAAMNQFDTALARGVDIVLAHHAPDVYGALRRWGLRGGLVAVVWRRRGFPGLDADALAALAFLCAARGSDYVVYVATRWLALQAHALRSSSATGGAALWSCALNGETEAADVPTSNLLCGGALLHMERTHRPRVGELLINV